MKNTSKQKKVKVREVQKGLKNIDALFEELKNDATLPNFGEFVMTCLVMGNAECVNLKLLYPKLYTRLKVWLANHNEEIVTKNN